jgi:hypothetical protein
MTPSNQARWTRAVAIWRLDIERSVQTVEVPSHRFDAVRAPRTQPVSVAVARILFAGCSIRPLALEAEARLRPPSSARANRSRAM